MSSLDDLEAIKEIDKINLIKTKIKEIILSQDNLWKMIYYSNSNPLDEDLLENPYVIFNESTEDNKHGVVLFKEKNDEILNTECVTVLVTFSSEVSPDSDSVYILYIDFSIILKGVNIQILEDESSRVYKICNLIDENFNHIKIDDVGEIKRQSLKDESINEENASYRLSYKVVSTFYSDEITIYQHQQKDDEWGITRESYILLTTDNPILVDIQQPSTDDKTDRLHGYDLDLLKTMICDIGLITESSLIKYNDKYYRIKEILEYDDYWRCTLEVTYKAIIN